MPEPIVRGRVLAEGKTKQIIEVVGDPHAAILKAKPDITAGDGARHDVIPGKEIWATTTTCNVFRLLQACGLPVAFREQISPTEFIADQCDMLPIEVVVRREGHGSYLVRNPHLSKGVLFPQLKHEFFLKTKGRQWKSAKDPKKIYGLKCDDPLMLVVNGIVHLFDPHFSMVGQEPFLKLDASEVFSFEDHEAVLDRAAELAKKIFLVLEKAWQLLGRKLVDFKVEFGVSLGTVRILPKDLMLADVVDNDSWRLIKDGQYEDKQQYRDGKPLTEVAANYVRVAELTTRFGIPSQSLILWSGSPKDEIEPFVRAFCEFLELEPDSGIISDNGLIAVCVSGHKDPVGLYVGLQGLVQKFPDSVIIAYIGMSNGAGPTLSANCTVPVITVPVNFKEFKEDAWSSLRNPSLVPLMTVLEPKNAVLSALQILAMRNPRIYMMLRYLQESRLVNIVQT